jgi:hypothetical protein
MQGRPGAWAGQVGIGTFLGKILIDVLGEWTYSSVLEIIAYMQRYVIVLLLLVTKISK